MSRAIEAFRAPVMATLVLAVSAGLVSEPACAATPFVDTAVVGRSTGNDLALAMYDPGADRVRYLRVDGETGEEVLDRVVGATGFDARAIVSLPDRNSDGTDEVAVVGIDPDTGEVQALVRDGETGTFIAKLLYTESYDPLGAVVINGVSGPGSVGIGVHGVNPDGRQRVQIKNVATGGLVANVDFSAKYTPFAAEAIVDYNGNGVDDVVVLSTQTDNRSLVQIKDGLSRESLRIIYFSADYVPVDFAVIPDIDGGGKPEVAVLGLRSDGDVRLLVKDSVTGVLVGNRRFDASHTPLAIVYSPDAGSAAGLGVLGRAADDRVRLTLQDANTGAFLRHTWFLQTSTPLAVEVVPGVGALGDDGVVVIGEDAQSFLTLQGKDAAGGGTLYVNARPQANAGQDQSVDEGDAVGLDGSGSSDPDGGVVSYSWSLSRPPGSSTPLTGAKTATPSFTADVGGEYVATLEVSDGTATDTDVVVIFSNSPPVADAGEFQLVEAGDLVQLDGSGSSDPDGDQLDYTWVLDPPVGSTAMLSNASAESPTFTPDLVGIYTLTLTVSDGSLTSGESVVTVLAQEPVVVVSGTVTFDEVPHKLNGGLDYPNTTVEPARGVLVEVLDGGAVIDSTSTDTSGDFSFELPEDTVVSIRVKAQMKKTGSPSWDFRVVDNTQAGSLYSIESSSFDTGQDDLVVDLHAPSGWDQGSTSYAGTRSAAPFAILDAVYESVDLMLDPAPGLAFPSLLVNWSPVNNTGCDVVGPPPDYSCFLPEIGQIITTAYNFDPGVRALYILGDEDADTDEYDSHVIAHEFAHYLEDRIGRSDSTGGSHSPTVRLDPRVAFSEGWANAFSAMALGSTAYQDSSGTNQGSGFTFDVEDNAFPSEGWYNESSVHSVLYDIFDSSSDGLDSTSAGFFPIYSGMFGWHADTEALTSIFTLIPELKTMIPADAANIDTLLDAQSIEGPTMDIWASTETNDAGQGSDVLPLYTEVTVDEATPVEVCTIDQFGTFNRLSNRRFLTFDVSVSDQYRITVTGPADSDPDLFLYKQGVLNSSEGFVEAQEILTQPLLPGTHVVEVYDACIVFGSTANPTVCPNNEPPKTCLNVKVERL